MIRILILMFSINSYGQESEAFSKYDIAKLINTGLEFEDLIPKLRDTCEEEMDVTEIICDGPLDTINLNDYKVVQLNYEDVDNIPDLIKKIIPGESFESSKNGISVVVALPNDNKLFGLWGVFFKKDGDDFGDSHGSSIEISKTFKNGNTLTLDGSTSVYTKGTGNWRIGTTRKKNGELDEDVFYEQLFTNENLIQLTLDNIQKGNTFYFKAGAGWISLDSKNWDNLLLASGQQTNWHKLWDFYDFDYIPDGKEVRHGVNLDAFLGIQKNLINSKSTCRLRVYGDVGGLYTNIKNTSYLKGEAGSVFYFQKPESSFILKAGTRGEYLVHGDGSQKKISGSLGFQRGRTSMDLEYSQKFGDLRNHVTYNLRNKNSGIIDPTMTIKIRYIFGNTKNAKK